MAHGFSQNLILAKLSKKRYRIRKSRLTFSKEEVLPHFVFNPNPQWF